MKIGILGAENFHSRAFSLLMNAEKVFGEARVRAICGNDDKTKRDALAAEYGIDGVFETEREVICCSDAVMITYRRGADHFEAAKAALMAGKPCFIDKPFVATTAQAEELIRISQETGTPFCGGSTLKELPEIAAVKARIQPGNIVTIDYNADPESVFGGYSYYGSHSVELALFLGGEDYRRVSAFRAGRSVSATIEYSDRLIVINTSPIKEQLGITLSGAKCTTGVIPEAEAYRYGAAQFVNMVKSGEKPRGDSFYVASVRLLNEIERQIAR